LSTEKVRPRKSILKVKKANLLNSNAGKKKKQEKIMRGSFSPNIKIDICLLKI
jgi:hypothetical protein